MNFHSGASCHCPRSAAFRPLQRPSGSWWKTWPVDLRTLKRRKRRAPARWLSGGQCQDAPFHAPSPDDELPNGLLADIGVTYINPETP